MKPEIYLPLPGPERAAAPSLALVAAAVVTFGLGPGGSSDARAADLPCGPAEEGTIELDGLPDDWKDVEPTALTSVDGKLRGTVRCNLEPKAVFLLIDVDDEYLVRTKQARPGEDHLALTLGGRSATIHPGDGNAFQPKVTPPWPGMKVQSAQRLKGWVVELSIPRASLKGGRVPYALTLRDSDSKAQLAIERTAEVKGAVLLGGDGGDSVLEAFLKDRGIDAGHVSRERPVRVGRAAGRLVVADRYLVALTDGYVFVELPVQTSSDVRDVQVVDLAGDGRDAVVVRYREHGGEGAREVLAVYRFAPDQTKRVFAAEVGKESGPNRIDAKVRMIKRGRATDLEIGPGQARGWTAASYQEAPSEDAVPIPLPWSGQKPAVWQFRGDEAIRR